MADRRVLAPALEAALHEREYFRSILEAEPASVEVIAADGTLIAMNAAGLALIEASSFPQIERCRATDFVAPAHRDRFLKLHRRVITGETGTLEYEMVGLRGGHRWVEMQTAPLRDAG